jgi:hypothetical protein
LHVTDEPDSPASTRRPIGYVRIAIVVGACLALGLSAVVVLAASPSPTGGEPAASPGASAGASLQPGKAAQPRLKLPGLFRLGFGSMLGGRKGVGGGVGRGAITITRIDGPTLDLRTDDGWTRTITIGADTKITKSGKAATVADLKVGDKIVLRQKRNDDGTYTVTAIVVPTPVVAGTVNAVGDSSFTLKLRDGSTRIVNVSGTTTFKVGRADGTKKDVKVGSTVIVSGTEGPGSAFTASEVRVQVHLTRVSGEVTATSKDSITVKRRDGTSMVIRVGTETKLSIRGDTSPSLAEVSVGMRVVAVGTLSEDGKLDASTVFAATPKPKTAPTPTANPG